MHRIDMHRRDALDIAENVRHEVERKRRSSLFIQIEAAFTLARTAEALYRTASKKSADGALAFAWEAYSGAAKQVEHVSSDGKLHVRLTDRLQQVRAILDSLPPQDESTPSTIPR